MLTKLEFFLSLRKILVKKIRMFFSKNSIFYDQKLFLQKEILVVKNRVGKKKSLEKKKRS